MIRSGFYGKYKDKVYKITVSSDNIVYVLSNNDNDFGVNGFVRNMSYEKNPNLYDKYYATVTQEDIEWFCRIGTVGYYKGYRVGISRENENEYLITSGYVSDKNDVFTTENGFEPIDRYVFQGKVPKSEVINIVEVKEPINEYLKAPDNWDF